MTATFAVGPLYIVMLTPAMTAEIVPMMASVLLLRLKLGDAAPVVLLEEAVPLLPEVEIPEGSEPSANEEPHCWEAAFFTLSTLLADTFCTILRASVVIACPQSVQ